MMSAHIKPETLEQMSERFEQEMSCQTSYWGGGLYKLNFYGDVDCLIGSADYSMQFPCDYYEGLAIACVSLEEIALEWLVNSGHAADILDNVCDRKSSTLGLNSRDVVLIRDKLLSRDWAGYSHELLSGGRWGLEIEIQLESSIEMEDYDGDI